MSDLYVVRFMIILFMSLQSPVWSTMENILILISLLLIWVVQPIEGVHPCSVNAVLKFYKSVHLTTESRQSVIFDFGDFVTLLDNIQASVEPFVKEISDYSTIEQLDELAVVDLEPFNNRVNLVPIANETIENVFKSCAKLNASLFGFEDKTEMALMTEKLKKKNIEKVMFSAFILNAGIYGFGSQKHLFKIPSGWDGTALGKAKVLWFKADGTIELNNSGTGTGYCQKPASPFQSVKFETFEGRTWLGLVTRSIEMLNNFNKLYSSFKLNLNSIRMKTYNEEAMVDLQRVVWTSPESFLRAHEFISHYDYDKTWDESTGTVLYELSQFISDVESINYVLKEEVIINLRRMTILPKRAIKTRVGLLATRVDAQYRLTGGKNVALFRGDVVGKSTESALKVNIYRGYAHVVTPGEKAADAFILAFGSTYRAVENYEQFSFDCVGFDGTQYCSQHSSGRQEAEFNCGEFFMGLSNSPEGCRMEKVTEPIAYNAYCSEDGEVISSFSEAYTLSIWCNGHMSEVLKLDEGVSEIRSDCEVRSADGRTQYSTQHGQVESRKAIVVKLRQAGDTKVLENLKKLGEPLYGTIFGLSLSLIFVIMLLVLKCIGLQKCLSILRCKRTHIETHDIPMREMEPLRQEARRVPFQIFNLNPTNRGEIVPRTVRRYRN